MCRVPRLVLVIASIVFGMFVAGGLVAGVGAQEATPPAGGPPPGGFEIAPGVTAEALAFAEGRQDPSVYRLMFDAGVSYPISESPALEVVYVESGSFTLTLSVPVTIGQVESTGEGRAVAANTEFTVEAGEYFVLPPFTTGEVNTGDEPGSVSIANVIPGGAMPAATPSS